MSPGLEHIPPASLLRMRTDLKASAEHYERALRLIRAQLSFLDATCQHEWRYAGTTGPYQKRTCALCGAREYHAND